ncbi:MAG: hypothetical protein HYV14_03230 [Elusimicrobia bacterium]|nr:hypothetical protein [Elusimicrobiota bacterium]
MTMKNKLPIKEIQIQGVLTGNWPPEAREFAADPKIHLSIKRIDIAVHLKQHPQAAHDYLKRWEMPCAADIPAIWREKEGYRVAWMAWDGKAFDVQKFSNLIDAVVEHVSMHNGIMD